MAKVMIKDFMVQLGFDSTAVTKGLAKVEKDVKKLSSTFVGLATKQKNSNSAILKGINAINAAKAKQLALDKKLGQSSHTVINQTVRGPNTGNSSQDKRSGSFGPDRGRIAQLQAQEAARDNNRRGVSASSFGPDRNALKRNRAEQRAALRERRALETQAHSENRKRGSEAITLSNKRLKLEGDLDRRIAAITNKYGDNDLALRKTAKSMTRNKKEADAFVKSIKDSVGQLSKLRDKVGKTSTSRGFVQLNNEIKSTAADTRRLNSELAVNARRLSASQFAARGMKNSLKNLANSYVSVFAVVGGGIASGSAGQGLIAAKASLLAASGSAEQAAIDFKFLQQQSELYGTSLQQSAKAYTKIGAAARLANLSMEDTRNMFIAANEASVAFGLTGDEVNGVFKAFSDILSKGTVSAEEIKGQLGDRLPIAIGVASKAMGVGTKELMKMMEQGQLVASDFLPKFSKELRIAARTGGALSAGLNTSRTAMGRFKNSFEANVLESFEAGAESGLSDFFNNLTEVLKDSAPAFRLLGKAIGGLLSLVSGAVRLLSQLLRPLAMLLDKIFGDKLKSGIKGANGELKEAIDLVDILADSFMFLAGVVALPFGILEKNLNDFDKLFGLNAQSAADAGQGKLGQIFNGFLGTAEDFGRGAFGMTSRHATPTTKTVNNNQVFNPVIQIENGDPESIKVTLDDYFQSTLTTSM